MEHLKADTDTQTEVDILIFDYLLCTSVKKSIQIGRAGINEHSHWDATQMNETLKSFMGYLPPVSTLSKDLQIKIRLFEYIGTLKCYYNLSIKTALSRAGNESEEEQNNVPKIVHGKKDAAKASHVATSFISLCNLAAEKISNLQWVGVASQLCTLAALDEYKGSTDEKMDFSEYVAKMIKSSNEDPENNRDWPIYIARIQLPAGISLRAYIGTLMNMPLPQVKLAVLSVLINIMESLDPPMLTQLEQGKISGLSRAETRQLKDRVGLH